MKLTSKDLGTLDRLADLRAGDLTLSEFKEWLYPSTIGCDEGAVLVAQVKLLLAEHSSGHRTDDELRELLDGLARAPAEIDLAPGLPASNSLTSIWEGEVRLSA